jgi:hypothetical protein
MKDIARCLKGRSVAALHGPKNTQNLDLIAHNPCDIAALMNSSVCIVRNNTMTRFGWAVEDVAR